MSRFNEKGMSVNVFMAPIDAKQEAMLDAGRTIVLNGDHTTKKENCLFYGEVDLDNDDDIKHIKNNDVYLYDNTGMINTNFNYDAGTITATVLKVSDVSSEQVYKTSPCSDPLSWFKFNYCKLGKPQRIVVYRF